MTEKYSNLVSQRYCKACGSFAIERIHRGFFKKKVLKSPMLYQCKNCEKIFDKNDFEQNDARRVPMFLE